MARSRAVRPSPGRSRTWTARRAPPPPVLTAVADRTDAENAVIMLTLVATDPDGDVLTYSATGLPGGLSVNATTGVISGTLSYTSAGVYSVTATVSDGTLSASQGVTWTVTNVDRPPVLSVVADRTDAENATVSLPLVATDPDGDALTYSATGLPGGLSVNTTTGVISGTLSYTSAGPHTVTATVSDGTLSSSQTFAWTVTNVDRPPVLSAVADRTDLENATVSLPLVATDPDGDALTYSATGLPSGLSVNPSTGLISGMLSYTSSGPHTVTATVSDGTLASSQTFAWTVTNVDRPPVLSAVADRTDLENATVSLPLVATDPDGDVLTYSATGLPGGLSVNATTGVISGTLSYTSAGPHTVTATVSDGTLASSQTFAWTVTNVDRR